MQGAQKLRSEAHLHVRRNDEVEAQRRRWTFYETIINGRQKCSLSSFRFQNHPGSSNFVINAIWAPEKLPRLIFSPNLLQNLLFPLESDSNAHDFDYIQRMKKPL
jgi:hypothetical protein